MIVGADTETGLIEPGLLAPPLVVLSAALDDAVELHRYTDAEEIAYHVFQVESAWANFPFDGAVLGEQYPDLIPIIFDALAQGRVHDVLTREKLLAIGGGVYALLRGDSGSKGSGYSLAAVARRRLGMELDKGNPWRLRYIELRDTPIERWPTEAVRYAEDDSTATLGIFHAQEDAARKFDEEHGGVSVLANEAAQVRAHWALHLISCWGVMTNPRAVDQLDALISREWEETVVRLRDAGLVRGNGTRNTAAAKALVESVLGYVPKMTPTGEPVLDEETCWLSGDQRLVDYARFSYLLKLRSTYVAALRRVQTTTGGSFPIQCRYEEIVDTGRTSASSPNVQNLPREPGVRECFVPRPGCVLVSCDWGMAELVSLAQVCIDLGRQIQHDLDVMEDTDDVTERKRRERLRETANNLASSKLAEALNDGFDPHLGLAAQILGISYEEAKTRSSDPVVKDMRQMCKAADFGFPGGLGPDKFVMYAKASWGVELTREQAVRLKAEWLRTWPEMKDYFAVVDELIADGWVEHPRSLRIRGGVGYTDGCNGYFQGLTADAAKDTLWEVCRLQELVVDSPLYGTHTVVFVHDELIVEAPEERGHQVAMELQRVMVEVYHRWTPDVKITAEPVIMRRWSKDAKQVWKNGRLMPWDVSPK